jgi:hypothetical protein
MARTALLFAAAILLSATAGQASAAQCRDAAGKFTACPAPAAQKGPCRDANGKFTKCAASAKPAGTTTAAAKTATTAKPAPKK